MQYNHETAMLKRFVQMHILR